MTLLPRLNSKFQGLQKKAFTGSSWGSEDTWQLERSIADLSEELISTMRRISPTSRYVTDKLPTNFLLLGLKHILAPQAKVIHVTRNPIDTCFSNFKKQYEGKLYFTNSLEKLGEYYVGYADLMEYWKSVLPHDRLYEVNYEALIAKPEEEAKNLFQFLELAWDPSYLDFL